MIGSEKIEVIKQKELKYRNNLSHWFLIIRFQNRYFLAIHNHQSAIVYRQVHNLMVAYLVVEKLNQKLSKNQNYRKNSVLLTRAFRFQSLFQTLFFLNILGMKKIHHNYVMTLLKRYNLKGTSYFTCDKNNIIKDAIIEVRFAPKYELFGQFVSPFDETHFHFVMHRKFKRILRA